MINLEQQRDYLKLLKTIYNKVYRLCGEGSDQELAMLDTLVQEKAKLARMEVGDAQCYTLADCLNPHARRIWIRYRRMVREWHDIHVLVHCVHYRTGIRKVEIPLDSCEPFTMMVRIEERKQLNLGGQRDGEIKILTSGVLYADLVARLVACVSQLRPVWRSSD